MVATLDETTPSLHPMLDVYADRMGFSTDDLVGREEDLMAIRETMLNPLQNSVLLLGPAGVGKTKIIETWASRYMDQYDTYSLDLTALGSEGPNIFANRLRRLVTEIITLSGKTKKISVIFIDEVHMLGMPGYDTGLEALKPAMARGNIRLIGATTDGEYRQYLQGNTAFDRRFRRLNIEPPSDDATFAILKKMWSEYLVDEDCDEDLLHLIITYANRYIPGRAQPSKSIDILDSMIGRHLGRKVPLDVKMLNNIVEYLTGANPAWKVDVPKMMDYMHKRIFGQDFALSELEKSLYISVAHLNDTSRPMGVFLLAGSTGVGKTETVRAMGVGLFGSEDALIRYDMSEYQSKETVDDFRVNLADDINKHPFSIVLLDEVEKAHDNILKMLLQITDDGRLTNRWGLQTTFKNAYICMTTNAGHDIMKSIEENSQQATDYQRLIREQLIDAYNFPPELLGRLDNIIPYQPLDVKTYNQLAQKRLSEFAKRLAKRGVYLRLNENVIPYMVQEHFETDTNAGGGRALQKRLKRELVAPVAKLLCNHPQVIAIDVNIFGKMSINDKYDPRGNAHVGIQSFVTMNGSRVIGNLDKNWEAVDEKHARVVKIDVAKSKYYRRRQDYRREFGI